ncbi:MAG: protease [Methanobacteriota archaeon]|nr:MAG: protease [Euryarchaeota archaeon]
MKFKLFLTLMMFIFTLQGFSEEARLLSNPDISHGKVVFVYAGDLWLVSETGGKATRLTAFPGVESEPHFSPDGKYVAFTGQYEGNADVYIIPVEGGEPVRLTWHPSGDLVRGWSRDGKYVIFASNRTSAPDGSIYKFYRISINGGNPEELPVPWIYEGKFSPDEKFIAYQKVLYWDEEWRNYRGGQAQPIRVINVKTLEQYKLPWDGANDKNPVWIGNKIYFLSDRDYAMNVWSYDINTKEVKQVTFFKEFDCKHLEDGDGKLVFENGGYIYILDPANPEPKKLNVTVTGDFPWARPHWVQADKFIRAADLSPSGKRAVFEARGEIFTVPAKKGSVRNLTNSSGSAEREPAWSPDGQKIAYFSDKGGEYHLVIADQYGKVQKKINFKKPTFYYTLKWSSNSKYVSFTDANRNLYVLNVETEDLTVVDNEGYTFPERTIYPEWSPDSKWLAYTKRLKNNYNAIFVYSLSQKKSYQITDGMAESKSPAWDKSGKYIYFLASTDYGLNVGWLDLSSTERPYHNAIYMAILPSDEPSPLLPESDEEGKEEKEKKEDQKDKKEKNKKDENAVRIDFKKLDQRIIALNIPEGQYSDLKAGEEGTLFYLKKKPEGDGYDLMKYTLKDKESKPFLTGVFNYVISHDGKKLLVYTASRKWAIVDANGKPDPGKGMIKTNEMKFKVEPYAEWMQIFREAWRYQRDYFYVRNVHGLDLDWAYKTYSEWVKYCKHRDDLNYILDILGGETSVGHSFVRGGDYPEVPRVNIGMLGADIVIENGHYRIQKIYDGENWNPDLRAPLRAPGININEGDYLLAVNGKELSTSKNFYSYFEGMAEKQIILTVNNKPTFSGAREVTVVPVRSENTLRQKAWIENNRRIVDKLSNGKLAYVWLPNTALGGYESFNRYYFAQKDKKGVIVDERFNHGGKIADYVIDLLDRELMGYFNNPIGNKTPFTAPNNAIFGPKVMLINEMAGSGGDMLPYMFKKKKIGPLVGMRTWGGLVGIWDVPPLIDFGFITAPRGGFYDTNGEWRVENEGVAPDIEVDMDPKLMSQGRDPQLEKAVEVCLDILKTQEVKLLPQPPDPVRVKRPGK